VNTKVLVAGGLITVPLVVVLAIGFQHDPRQIDSPLVGKPAPGFALTPVDGGATVALTELRGKPVVINFWATWCVPCKQEHPALVQVARLFEDEVSFVGVVYQDEPAKIERWLGQYGSAYPTVVDEGSRAAIAYGVYGVPETFVVDAAGTIVHKYTGPVDPNDLVARLDQMVAR